MLYKIFYEYNLSVSLQVKQDTGMGATIIEKIIASHSDRKSVNPGDITDVRIDARVARDFGGANVVKNMEDHRLAVDDPSRTFFTFDCNPTGSDQKYAANQHRCRTYARGNDIRVFDIDKGIGTHILIEEGLAYPGSTAVSTDSHANILGAVGAFGQGMGDKDIAAAWNRGKVWFKTPPSAKVTLKGKRPSFISAKDIVLNLLAVFGANSLLGHSVEMTGEVVDQLTLDERITIASMATEMGAIIILFPPNQEVMRYCESRAGRKIEPVHPDRDASYALEKTLDVSAFIRRVSQPGKPHDTAPLPGEPVWLDSAFIGSCTNGRMLDIAAAANVLKNRKIEKDVVLKVVPSTNRVWEQALETGYIETLKEAGALISNAGCAGCAAGQVGQNGPGEVTISTGNRNFPGKQGKGEVYLASPEVVAASAVAGYITTPDQLDGTLKKRPDWQHDTPKNPASTRRASGRKPVEVTGRIWFIPEDNIDTDMIYHNRYLTVTDPDEMKKYALDNLDGYSHFAGQAGEGDIIITGKNFGAGSSRQQAVDCFKALGISCIVASSFGAIYERNAINAAFPILTSNEINALSLENGDELCINFETGKMKNLTRGKLASADPFSEVQMEIYQNGGLF